MKLKKLESILNAYDNKFGNRTFAASDPVQIPMQYNATADAEISAFLTALICWGQRQNIISTAKTWMGMMGHRPHEFVLNYNIKDQKYFKNFYYRTFNASDAHHTFIQLQKILLHHGSIENAFCKDSTLDFENQIRAFRLEFLNENCHPRLEKHISNIDKNAAAKRLCLFLKWMVRSSAAGTDLGLWTGVSSSSLMIPLDVHVCRAAYKLEIIDSNLANWKHVKQITACLKTIYPEDPIKYDTALFCIGAGFKL
jgi:uncharacterized protein (TIGR02757 family)